MFRFVAIGSHAIRIPPAELEGAVYAHNLNLPNVILANEVNLFIRLTHDLFLSIWKSNVSLTLMMNKKAKRFVLYSYIECLCLPFVSALSMRLFGADITPAAPVETHVVPESDILDAADN